MSHWIHVQKGDLYLSGLSFAVGLSDKTLISTNLVELSGFGAALSDRDGVSVNPNFELKHQLLFRRSAKREWAMSTGVTMMLNAFNGIETREVDCIENTSTANTKRRKNYIDSPTSNRTPSYYGGDCYNAEPGDTWTDYDRIHGWRTQAYLANTISWLRENGRANHWHLGFRGEQQLNVEDYGN